ncbi:formate hydrogenlyase maturation HycH family protein [Photobacterium swingsii]|uniref:formate hydrogenlyase maturation HycH family protein n=1 Tax=Photobacterium swingsii TaxID=680026 RepID=UPI0040680529
MSEEVKEAEQALKAGNVMFYALSRKFVDEQYDVPEEAKQVLYYSLAIGHHLGVVDCLKTVLQCTRDEYKAWIEKLPQDSEAYRKMAGFFTFGEITIYPDHLHMLAGAFSSIPTEEQDEKQQALTAGLIEVLTDIYHEPTMYLMVRSR